MNDEFENQNNSGNYNPENASQTPKDNSDDSNNVNVSNNSGFNTASANNSGTLDYNASNAANTSNSGYDAGNVIYSNNSGYSADNANITGNANNSGYNAGNANNTGYDAGNVNNTNSTGYDTGNVNYSSNSGYNAGNVNNANSTGYDAGNVNYSNNSGYNTDNANVTGNSGYNNNWNGQDGSQYSQYGGNPQYKWNYDDYQKALNQNSKPPKKKNGLKPLIITVCCIFGVGILGLATMGVFSVTGIWHAGNGISSTSSTSTGSKNPNGPSLNIENQPQTTTTTTSKTTGEMSTTQVASKLTPEVVGIVDYSLTSVEPTAEGSGIVMSSDGYIITNEHVIDGAQKIRVVMSNGKTYDNVKVVGSDTQTDLAVLKVNATGLAYASFGDSSQLKVGQSVIAIGNPGGLELASTVTNGIVSGLNRTISESSSNMTYIQTNALINPGNSGGPLVNMYGQVVGINCSKIESNNGTTYEGIGFAIPINSAKPIIDSLIKNGYVTGRVKVGISVYSLSNSQAQWYSYPSGLYVEDIDQ